MSTDLLAPTRVYKLNPNSVTYGLYYSPSVTYFGKYHLPYAILAIIVLTLFVSIPTTVLMLYPFQFFHKFLSYFSVNWHFLHVYVDSFQGCYKDGTEPGTFDCRWFSILMVLIRPLFFIIFGFTLSVMFFVYALIVLIILLTITINVQPFKKSAVRYPSTDSTFFVLLSLSYVSVLGMDISSTESQLYNKTLILICLLSAFIPIFYIAFFILSWLISKMRWSKVILSKNCTSA